MDIDWRLMAETVATILTRLNEVKAELSEMRTDIKELQDAVNNGVGRMNAVVSVSTPHKTKRYLPANPDPSTMRYTIPKLPNENENIKPRGVANPDPSVTMAGSVPNLPKEDTKRGVANPTDIWRPNKSAPYT